MSKEKQCECCHEWWYGSDVKENLCPNCYDYFKQLKQQLKEKDNLIEFGKEEIRKRNKRIDEIVERDKKLFYDKNKELEKLKQQLAEAEEYIENDEVTKREYYQKTDEIIAEKDKEIKKLNWQLKDKDFTIKNLNHSLSVAPNANAGQRARIDELTKIVKEKDKEIETLKQELEEINAGYDFTYEQSSGAIKELKQNQTQLAIQELEKVKDYICDCTYIKEPDYTNVRRKIDNQIKELKGE